jgi:hypothetical protein
VKPTTADAIDCVVARIDEDSNTNQSILKLPPLDLASEEADVDRLLAPGGRLLAKHRPSWTIQAQPGPAIGPFHWESRLLSRREMARLQTFPAGVTITGTRAAAHKQLGNAVPSLLAEVIGRAVANQFFGVPWSGKCSLAVKPKRPIPPPEPVQPVPEKYLHLQGEHAEHPGTGKGYAASRKRSGERKFSVGYDLRLQRSLA